MYRTLLFLVLLYLSESESRVSVGYHLEFGVPKALEVLKNEGGGYKEAMSRIVGGSQVGSADAIPYQAGILIRLTTGWTSICGGALVSTTRVLTGAHCWWDGTSQAGLFTVVLGSLTIFTGGTRLETKDVTSHPSWNPNTFLNDVAVVRISQVTFSNTIQVIPLPSMANVNLDFVGQTGTVAGYGKTSDAQNSFPTTTALHQVSVQIISNAACQASFSANIHGSHLCTSGLGNIGTCEGDSGGPLTVVLNNQRTLIGLVSFGPSEGCQAGLPSVYTRLTAFLSWIQSVL